MTYSLEIYSLKSWPREQWALLCRICDIFLYAGELGFFGDGIKVLDRNIDYRYDSNSEIISILYQFDTEPMDTLCFAILVGMLNLRIDLRTELDSIIEVKNIMIKKNGIQLPSQEFKLNHLESVKENSVKIYFPDYFQKSKPFVIFFNFSRPLDQNGETFLKSGLKIWEKLVTGGLPDIDIPPGESFMGKTMGYFCEPTVFHLEIGGIWANSICFALLLNFLNSNINHLPVKSVDID